MLPEKTVVKLLSDLLNITEEYCIGSIILQDQGDYYDIIDGQQRLVTLSLIMLQLGVGENISLCIIQLAHIKKN